MYPVGTVQKSSLFIHFLGVYNTVLFAGFLLILCCIVQTGEETWDVTANDINMLTTLHSKQYIQGQTLGVPGTGDKPPPIDPATYQANDTQ